MLLDTKEAECTIQVLRILDKGTSKYKNMFRETKVSHTTLQGVLKELIQKDFIERKDNGKNDIDYRINEKGKNFWKKLKELNMLSR